MTRFTIFTPANAPPDSADLLRDVEDALGFIPNIHATFAASPVALQALAATNAAFAQSSFSAAEREVISLTTSVFNRCDYCIAGHSAFGLAAGISRREIGAIRAVRPVDDRRLEALRALTLALLADRGAIGEAELDRFLNAGFLLEQVFDLLVGIAAKVMTNFASKAAGTPVDPAFKTEAQCPARSDAVIGNA